MYSTGKTFPCFCNNVCFWVFFKTDDFTHLYTLILRPDLTYEVKIDNYVVEAGHLEDDWDFLPPKRIIDHDLPKPDYWDERETIPDPMDKKPEVQFHFELHGFTVYINSPAVFH